jgi:hypothetical protein
VNAYPGQAGWSEAETPVWRGTKQAFDFLFVRKFDIRILLSQRVVCLA